MYYHTSIPIDSYIGTLKRVAKEQNRRCPEDRHTSCLARIAQFAGFQSWSSLQDHLHLSSLPGRMLLISERNKIISGLPKAIPEAFKDYVFLEAFEALRHRFIRKNSIDELGAAGLELIDVYVEVLSDFEGMLPKAMLTSIASDLEQDGVWGTKDEIMIDEFSISDG